MDDQQVGAPLGRLAGHLGRRVDREQHLRDVGVRVAVHEADGVPVVGGGGRVPAVEQVDEVAEAWACGRLVMSSPIRPRLDPCPS